MANESQSWTGCKLSEDTHGEAFRVSKNPKSEDKSHLAAINIFAFWKKYVKLCQRNDHSKGVA